MHIPYMFEEILYAIRNGFRVAHFLHMAEKFFEIVQGEYFRHTLLFMNVNQQ